MGSHDGISRLRLLAHILNSDIFQMHRSNGRGARIARAGHQGTKAKREDAAKRKRKRKAASAARKYNLGVRR